MGADGTQVGAAVGQGFAEAGKGGHCQVVLRFGFQPSVGILTFGFLAVQTGLE